MEECGQHTLWAIEPSPDRCGQWRESRESDAFLWKVALQQFSDTFDLKVPVLHYPPGTSKWKKIEQRDV